MALQRITPFLWFDSQAEEAAEMYCSIFPNSKVGKVARYGEAGPGPAGTAMTVEFVLDGQPFIGLNGGPHFKFNEAVSFVVNCESQDEVDFYWQKLAEGGAESRCGWLKDKFGLSWQVVPTVLSKLMTGPNSKATQRAFQAMMGMKKLDIRALQQAYDGA